MIKTSLITILVFLFSIFSFATNPMIKKFNHNMHDEKVFVPNQIKCAYCHNVENSGDGKFIPNSNLKNATFQKPLKAICHECHKVDDKEFKEKNSEKAPKSCYTCHDSFEKISAIRPKSHQSKIWQSSHGLDARADSSSCLNCHSNSQCSTCHSKRNTILPKNHLRNYRFYHSVEARMSPQRCDACHTKTYCTQCHIGKKSI